jgi:hypothetical protein
MDEQCINSHRHAVCGFSVQRGVEKLEKEIGEKAGVPFDVGSAAFLDGKTDEVLATDCWSDGLLLDGLFFLVVRNEDGSVCLSRKLSCLTAGLEKK